MSDMDHATATQLEAAAFRRLVAHLRERTDVQNIDLMNLAGFCRNCLSNWYQEAAADTALPLARMRRARSSTACPTRNGSSATRPKRRRKRRLISPSRPPLGISRRPLADVTCAPQAPHKNPLDRSSARLEAARRRR